jgi:DNA-binding protein H-NS
MPVTHSPDIEKMSYDQLKTQRSKIDELMAKRQAEIKQKLADMASKADLRVQGFTALAKGEKAMQTATPKAANGNGSHGQRKARSKGKGRVKYRNPDNAAQVWTGHGPKPGWLKAKIESGAPLEQFAIA